MTLTDGNTIVVPIAELPSSATSSGSRSLSYALFVCVCGYD